MKSNLQDNSDWANSAFETARTTGACRGQFQVLEESWWRQRSWGIDFAMQALSVTNHSLLKYIQKELAPLENMQLPDTSKFQRISDPSNPIVVGDLTISLDPVTGNIIGLSEAANGLQYVSFLDPEVLILSGG